MSLIALLIVFIILMSSYNKALRRGRPWHPAVLALGIPFLIVLSFSKLAFPALFLGLILLKSVGKASRLRPVPVARIKPPKAPKILAASSLPHVVEPRLEFGARLDSFLREVRSAAEPVRLDSSKPGKRDSSASVLPDFDPRPSAASVSVPTSPSVEGLLREFGAVLPPEAAAKIRVIGARVDETNAYLRARDRAEGEHAFLLRQTTEDYLPGIVKAYARLPRSLADSAPLDDGKTGKDLLLEQLDLLDRGVLDILAAAARAEGQDLLANGRFLKDRFDAPRGKDFEI